jgi:hypothetical protein
MSQKIPCLVAGDFVSNNCFFRGGATREEDPASGFSSSWLPFHLLTSH